jgi:hypothetical protein
MEIIMKCKDCQFFQKQTTKHTNPLRPIDLFWPFAIWGIDIMGVLPREPGGFRFIRHYCHVHQVDGSYASGKYHARSSNQVPVEYHLQVRRTQVGPQG